VSGVETNIRPSSAGAGTTTKTHSEKESLSIQLTGGDSIYQGKLLRMALTASCSTVDTTGFIKNITVTGTRGIAAALGTPINPIPAAPPGQRN